MLRKRKALGRKDWEFYFSLFIIFVSAALLGFFPQKGGLNDLFLSFAFLFALPALFILFILKRKLSNFGLQMKDVRSGSVYLVASLIAMGICFYFFIQFTPFEDEYVIGQSMREDFDTFLLWFFTSAFIIFLYEFFFRGFVLFTFAKKLGWFSVPIQWILIGLMFFIFTVFNWQNSLDLFLAPFAGFLAYATRSMIFSFIFSFLSVIIINAILIMYFN